MEKLNPKVKKKWLAALKSGKYRKAKGHLKHHGRHCCLGVLCDLFDPAGWEDHDYGGSTKLYAGRDTTPPEEVIEWSGLTELALTRLMNANDETTGWGKVIQLIEEDL